MTGAGLEKPLEKLMLHSFLVVRLWRGKVLYRIRRRECVQVIPAFGQAYSGIVLLPSFFCLFGWLVGWFLNVLVNHYVISRTGHKTERLTILHAAEHETELGDHDFCLSRSHYTDTDPTSRELVATAGIEPGISSPGAACSTE